MLREKIIWNISLNHEEETDMKPYREMSKQELASLKEQLEALYTQALPLAEKLILEFVAKLDTDEPLDKAYDHTFGEF